MTSIYKTQFGKINEAMLKFLIKHNINVKIFNTVYKWTVGQ